MFAVTRAAGSSSDYISYSVTYICILYKTESIPASIRKTSQIRVFVVFQSGHESSDPHQHEALTHRFTPPDPPTGAAASSPETAVHLPLLPLLPQQQQ